MSDFDLSSQRRSPLYKAVLKNLFLLFLFLAVMFSTLFASLWLLQNITPGDLYSRLFPPPVTPVELYHQAWVQVGRTLLDQDKLADWPSWEHRFDAQIHTREDAIFFANQAIRSTIKDGYTSLQDISGVSKPVPAGWEITTGIRVAPQLDDRWRCATDGNGNFLAKSAADGLALIGAVLDGTPASKAGLKSGDAIVSIDGKTTAGVDIRQINRWLQLPENRPALLVVRTASGVKSVSLDRVRVFDETVKSRVLDGNIGYLSWTNFLDKGIEKSVESELTKLDKCAGLIVDLRDNDGGSILSAIYIVSMFLDRGDITTTEQRLGPAVLQHTVYSLEPDEIQITEQKTGEKVQQSWSHRAKNRLGDRPLIVLVGGHTASASELFCGALRDNGKAVLVGTNTLGKGVGFSPRYMPLDTMLVAVSFKYFTPSGHWPGDGISEDAPGIELDLFVPPDSSAGPNNDNQLEIARYFIGCLLQPGR